MNKLTKNNTVYLMDIKSFINLLDNKNNLLFEESVGDIQRNIDTEHLQDLIAYQENYYEKNGEFSFPVPIILCSLDNKYSIIDGQHRYEAIKFLYKKYKINFYIMISQIIIYNIDEYDDYFIAINKNKPVKIYNIDEWKNSVKKIEKYFIDNWKSYIKNTNNPLIPHINLENMKKYIHDNNLLNNVNYETFIGEMINLNNFYKFYWKQYIREKGYIKNIETYINKCESKDKNNPLYLTLFKNFEWINKVIYKIKENVEYEQMEHFCSNYRMRIPKKIRRKLWMKYFDETIIGTCHVCCDKLYYDDFECGHVKSVFYGGTNDISNMRPICRICNNDMGIKNMDEYKNNYSLVNN